MHLQKQSIFKNRKKIKQMEENVFNLAYEALKEYHASIKDQVKENYVPMFCINHLILELNKKGLEIVAKK